MSPPITTDFDGAWKFALEQFFPDFLALFFPEAFTAIDWRYPISFRPTELQQIAPDDQQGKQRADTLVAVQRLDGTPAQIFVHVEVQSQHDREFSERMFRYHARLFDRNRIPVVSLAILGDENPHWLPSQFGYTIWGCALTLHFPSVKLVQLDAASLEATRNPFATLTLLHRDAQETRGQPEERMQRKLARFRSLFRLGYPAATLRSLLRLMEHLLRLSPDLVPLARARMHAIEAEETGMDTLITSFEELAREEGQIQGQQALVLRLLARRVGTLDTDLTARIKALTPDTLLDLSDALLDFTALADLQTWLTTHAGTATG